MTLSSTAIRPQLRSFDWLVHDIRPARQSWFKGGQVELVYEKQESLPNQSSSPFAGNFQRNPRVAEGDFVRAALVKNWNFGFTGATRLTVAAEGLVSSDSVSTRFWGAGQLPYYDDKVIASLRFRGGVVAGADLPQTRFRLGGPQTVRGHVYGVRNGRTFWAAQGALELTVSQWWSPVVFVDVGNVDFSSTPLVGVGAGVSLASGWLRLELAHGLTDDGILRFDIYAQIPTN